MKTSPTTTTIASCNAIEVRRSHDGRFFELKSEIVLPADRGQVFSFFSDASQLESLTPPWLRFAVITDAPIAMRAGALIDYRLRIRGFPCRWRSRISVWEPPNRFVDEQVWGPYRFWRHEHIFEAQGNHTLCRDIVQYLVPGGRLIHSLLVRGDIVRIFEYRQRRLRELFSGSAEPPVANRIHHQSG